MCLFCQRRTVADHNRHGGKTGACSPVESLQQLVSWPFNICCRLNDLCPATGDLHSVVRNCLAARERGFTVREKNGLFGLL